MGGAFVGIGVGLPSEFPSILGQNRGPHIHVGSMDLESYQAHKIGPRIPMASAFALALQSPS